MQSEGRLVATITPSPRIPYTYVAVHTLDPLLTLLRRLSRTTPNPRDRLLQRTEEALNGLTHDMATWSQREAFRLRFGLRGRNSWSEVPDFGEYGMRFTTSAEKIAAGFGISKRQLTRDCRHVLRVLRKTLRVS